MDQAANTDTNPARNRKAWVATYVMAWFGTYLLYAMLATWIYGRQLSESLSFAHKAALHGTFALGQWLLCFGIGLIVGLVALAVSWKNANRSRVFWWTALVACWLFGAFVLYTLYASDSNRVVNRVRIEPLTEQNAETHAFTLDEVKPALPPTAETEANSAFSIDEVKPTTPPIIAVITIQDTEGTSENDLSIDALENLEQIIVAITLKKARAWYAELGGDPKTFHPHIDSNAVYVEIGGKKLAVVRINVENRVRSIAVMGFRGKEFVRVTCLRESNDEILLFRGTCADKVKEAFGVSLR
jgi:hypothetical protein